MLTIQALCRAFDRQDDFFHRPIQAGEQTVHICYIDGMVSVSEITDQILRPLAGLQPSSLRELYDLAMNGQVYGAGARSCDTVEQATSLLLAGYAVLVIPGTAAAAFEVKPPTFRGPQTPQVENTVKGPKDAFVENIRTNTALVRRHLPRPDLRLREVDVGSTRVAVLWLEQEAREELPRRMLQRLTSLRVPALLTPASAEEGITGSRLTAFPLLSYTERPDRLCQGLLQGRVAVLVSGLPLGYLAPADLGTLMVSPEDEGTDFISASFVRILRYGALLLSLLLPGAYVAMTLFHQEMIPLPLLRAIIRSKESVPFSTAAEVMALLLAFELLQETGLHLPKSVGQSVSLIGGIVVGTAAVEAALISPAALIMVSIAGVCGFALPNRDLANALRLWRFFLAWLGAVGGLFAVTCGALALVIHLAGLTTLDHPYLAPLAAGYAPPLRKRVKNQDDS